MLTAEPLQPWKSWQKIVFRFLFLFLGFFLLNYELVFISFNFNFFDSVLKVYSSVAQPLHWLDKHLYHTGYDPKLHQSIPGDSHFGIVFYSTTVILIILAIIGWGIRDRHKTQYNRLYYWFRIYVRYMIALIMFGYGIDKLLPLQMKYPGVEDLLTHIGEQSRFTVLWNFMGASPGYEIFAGICEVTGSILLIFRRTYIFGSLFIGAILCNVVALNFFYNIPVKLYSSLLLISTLFLFVPLIHKLVHFFFNGRAVSLDEKHYTFDRGWKKYLVIALSVGILAFFFLTDIFRVNKRYNEYRNNRKREKLYDVTYFTTTDTLKPLLTDTLRWRRFAFTYRKSAITAIIYDMQDKTVSYDCDMDTVKHTYTLHNNPDTASWHVFHYSFPQKNMFQLTGKWKGTNASILMKEVSIDSMTLNKERIKFRYD